MVDKNICESCGANLCALSSSTWSTFASSVKALKTKNRVHTESIDEVDDGDCYLLCSCAHSLGTTCGNSTPVGYEIPGLSHTKHDGYKNFGNSCVSKAAIESTSFDYDKNKIKTRRGIVFDGISHSDKSKIDNGKFKINKKLDLHGMCIDKAMDSFISFVYDNYFDQNRNLLVITGWGKTTNGEKRGVLKNSIFYWLDNHTIHDKILYFRQARPHHGGHGAYYLILRARC